MTPKDQNRQNIISTIDSLQLPEDQIAIIEDYIKGAAGEEALEKLNFKDLTSVPSDAVYLAMHNLTQKNHYDEARMLFNILFAIGQSTCYNMVRTFSSYEYNQLLTKETLYKYLALYANTVGTDARILNTFYMSSLETFPVDLKDFIKAIDCQRGTDKGKAVLLAIYFKIKYTNKVIDNNEQIEIEKGDLALFDEYESIIMNNLNLLFSKQTPSSTLDEIKKAVHSDNIDNIRPLVRKNVGYTPYSMKFMGGLSYLNFPISIVFKNVVSLCFEINTKSMLNVLDDISRTLNISILKIGGDFDKLFGIDSKEYILWATYERRSDDSKRNILIRQMQTNRDIYLSIINEGINDKYGRGVERVNAMMEVVRENDSDLFQQIIAERTKDGSNKDMEIITDRFFDSGQFVEQNVKLSGDEKEKIKKYLLGKETIDAIYPFADKLKMKYYYGNRESDLIESFKKNYGECEFTRRCEVFMLFTGAGGYLRWEISGRQQQFFEDLEIEKLSISYQLTAIDIIDQYVHDESWKGAFTNNLRPIFAKYLNEKREETLTAFKNASALGRWFGLTVMKTNPDENKEEILTYTQDSSKLVKEYLLETLCAQKDWEDDIKKLLSSKKAGGRELGIRVLMHWQSESSGADVDVGVGIDYTELFSSALEKEKNAKIMDLIRGALKASGEETAGTPKTISNDHLVSQLHKGGKKRTLAWAYETPFSAVHKTNGEEAGEEYLQAILLCYSTAEKNGISPSAASLAEALNPNELAAYVNELFDKWLAQGAEAKKRWVLYAASIHGGADIVQKFQHQILEWAQNSRGAIASDAVSALALNPLPQALLIVDSISRKFKFKQVKAAAGEALEFAASQLGITKEELADRIVPNLGFDENMERIFDYGGRKFKVTITTALEIEVFDENGQKLKNLPAVAKKDDPEKAAAAYEEFKQMKKQMKTTVSSQKARLEFALSVKREWSIDAWKALFVKNPIMHQFAIGLIWGIYEDGKLTQSFRYMEDGSFNTEDEDEFTLTDDSKTDITRIGRVRIGLVHPIELTEVSLSSWKQQLEDYEIKQPIEQLHRTVYTLTDEEKEQKSLDRFGGYILNDLSLNGKLTGMGWYRGSVQDAGGFYTYYREDVEAGLGVELHFSGSHVGGYDGGNDVTVYEARFYQAGTIERGSYCYDEADDVKSIALKDIPPRYFSEIVLQLTKATASSQKKDENWRKTK